MARANGADAQAVRFPDGGTFAPVRIRVAVREVVEVRRNDERRHVTVRVAAEAELAPGQAPISESGGYGGPFAVRQGKRMRPDVAQAFDRMERAARADGVALIIASAYRSDAEQAVLFRAHPDPKWVAPPGTSLHRFATELDLGPPAAYAWLAANGHRFHFLQRYSHEPWHYGYTLNPRSTPRPGRRQRRAPERAAVVRARPLRADARARGDALERLGGAARRPAVRREQLQPVRHQPGGRAGDRPVHAGHGPRARAGGPVRPARAIDAQAHLMRDLLRRFASVPLALAAYNAGPGAVAGCMCVPPYPETRGYVARILGLLGGAGDLPAGAGLEVRLVG